MPKYENSVIYKLKRNDDYDDNDIYVGSTTNFKHRKNCHKTRCNNENQKEYNFPVYQCIRNNGGWDQWVMIPIEQYPCNNKDELKIRERYYIDLLKSKLNKQFPCRTIKEWRDDNKEKKAKLDKKYYESNKQIHLEKCKEYRNENKEYLQEYSKKYRDNNKEYFQEYKKQYYESNKQTILERDSQKVICDHCGCELRKGNLNRHKKTKKCLNFVKKD